VTKRQTDDPWRLLIEALPDGAVLTDGTSPDYAVLYANPAFERLTGYPAAELVGRGLAVFDSPDGNPTGHHRGREAMQAGVETRKVVHGLHRDGSSLVLDVHTVPVKDARGRITHWASVFRKAEARATQEVLGPDRVRPVLPRLPRLPGRRDALTGLVSRAGFDAVLRQPAAVPAGNVGPAVALFLVDVVDLAGYNDTFGRPAGDALLKRVGTVLGAAFRRSSDVIARWEGGTFAAVANGMEEARVVEHAEALRTRVRDLSIHHPHSRSGRYVNVSVAVAVAPAGAGAALDKLLDEARAALGEAKTAGQPVFAGRRRVAP